MKTFRHHTTTTLLSSLGARPATNIITSDTKTLARHFADLDKRVWNGLKGLFS